MFVGLEIACDRGLLFVADVRHRGEPHTGWIWTDSARKSGQARRLDGGKWPGPDGREFKSLSLRSDPDNPPGLADVIQNDRPAVLLSEGEPDALAGLTFAWASGLADKVGVVCVNGAARALSGPVLDALKGRRVRIARHPDEAGHRAAAAWLQLLTREGITADVLDLDGPGGDLADLLRDTDLDDLETVSKNLLSNIL